MYSQFRLVHKLITANLIPRFGSLDYIALLDACILWCFHQNMPINLPNLIMLHLSSVANSIRNHQKKPIQKPYAMILTKLFKFWEIDLAAENSVQMAAKNRIGETFYKVSQSKLIAT